MVGVIANSGHFNVEINIPATGKADRKNTPPAYYVESYQLKDGRTIRLLAEGDWSIWQQQKPSGNGHGYEFCQ